MTTKSNEDYIALLYKAVLTLETVDECKAFFKDLCTVPEIKAMAQRFAVAKMLSQNCKYNEIVEATGASTATISRVKRSIEYENAGGYNIALDRMDEE